MTLDPTIAAHFRRDLRLAQETVNRGICPSGDRADACNWNRWRAFCTNLAIDPLLNNIKDPDALLQVFVVQYRKGLIAPSGRPVKGRTVESAVRTVGQTLVSVGSPDPRLTSTNRMDFRLTRMWAAYKREDPPPRRVKPIPIRVLRHVANMATASGDPFTMAISDMITLAYFFLLRPGEYTATASDTTPFTLNDVQLFIGSVRLDIKNATESELSRSTFGTLEFTTQKNGVRGEVVGLGRSGDTLLCPVKALKNRVLHLHSFGAAPSSPLACIYHVQQWYKTSPSDISSVLRQSVAILGPSVGFTPSDISARSLRASGAMALLCAGIDHDRIKLLGYRGGYRHKYHVNDKNVAYDRLVLKLLSSILKDTKLK